MSVFRFAPSPNGFLHLGHAFSALLNDALARAHDGRLLLRIEDIDVARCRPEFEAAIYQDLAWLGLTWEKPVRRQSAHFPDYQAARERLAELLYPCFCSRGDIAARVAREEAKSGTQWPRDPDGAPLYPGTCRELTRLEVGRRIAAGETPAWRLDVAKAMRSLTGALAYRRFDPAGGDDWVAADPARWGDVIVARKEVPTSYHLSVVVDDALQGSRMWCAGATWRPPPTSTCFCRRCFGCRARPIIITGWSPTMPASSLPRAPDRRVSGS